MEKENVKLSSILASNHLNGVVFRRHLRDSGIKKPGSSWTWPKGHKDLAKVRALAKKLSKH